LSKRFLENGVWQFNNFNFEWLLRHIVNGKILQKKRRKISVLLLSYF